MKTHVLVALFSESTPSCVIIINLQSRQLEVKHTRSLAQVIVMSYDLNWGFSDSFPLPLSKKKKFTD
jgi:hypothetical protein